MKTKQTTSSIARAYNRLNQLSVNLGFDYDVYSIRQKCKLKINGSIPPEYKADFKNMANTLATKYKLSALPFKTLSDYILGRDFEFKDRPNYSLSNNGNSIIYNIYTDTTAKDILNDWPEIAKLQEKIYGGKIKKNYPRHNINRDFDILMLRENGKSCKEIVKIINKKYPKREISYQDISKIIQRLTNPPR